HCRSIGLEPQKSSAADEAAGTESPYTGEKSLLLAQHSMVQSMSRKANCWDNAPMESFFAVLKTECFYNAGELTVDELMKQTDDYMDYYNRERCSLKLKKPSPVAYRTWLTQSA
ncbi:IS3 family transposase, partial [Neisseria elongata]|uniref:IS3 family transposase n=1 Tax=Neisseria elongata TaxID=495 RepID=UPI0028E46C8F